MPGRPTPGRTARPRKGVESRPKIPDLVGSFTVSCSFAAWQGPLQIYELSASTFLGPSFLTILVSAVVAVHPKEAGGEGWTGAGRLSQLPSWPGGPSITGCGSRLCLLRAHAERKGQSPGIGAATVRACLP